MLESFNTDKFEYKRIPVEEQKARGIIGRLAGVIADTKNPTRNGRAYGLDLWKKVFDSDIMKEKIANRCLFGEFGHPADREETDPEKIAICLAEVPKIGKDGKIYGVFDILDSPMGRILKTMCDYGCNIGVSSRGSGDLITDYDGNEAVDPETYNCEAWDAVLVPAVKEARLQYVTESLNNKKYNKTLRQKLTEELNKASIENRKIIEESLDTLGIKLNEDTNLKESSAQELEKYFTEWKDANPDIELDQLISAYNGNLGSIMYNETEYNKFVKWCKAEHGININPIPQDTDFDLGAEDEEIPEDDFSMDEFEEEPAEETPTESEPLDMEMPMESLGEDGIATQLADVNIGIQNTSQANSEGLLLEDAPVEDDSFYVNDSPYGFKEIVYKGYVITIGDTFGNDDQVTVEISGDEAIMEGNTIAEKLQNAVAEIDNLDVDPEYHIEPWHDENDIQCASLDAAMEALGLNEPVEEKLTESMYSLKDGEAKKIAESGAKLKEDELEEEYTPTNLSEAIDLDEVYNHKGYTNAIQAIYAGIEDDTDEEALQEYLQNIIGFCREIASDYNLYVEDLNEPGQVGSDIEEVDPVESDGAVAELQETLKKVKDITNDNLSLQEKLSASNARETQLEEELARYKKATAALSKPAKENKSLKESLKELDKKSQSLAEELATATSTGNKLSEAWTKSTEENKKLTEQLGQLKTKEIEISKQLDESKALVEKYRKGYSALKESYVNSRAEYYGISEELAHKVLGESYKISDVDKSLRDLGRTKRNMDKLPVDLKESVKLSKANLSIKSNEKINSLDDTSLDALKSLLG